MNRGVAWLGPFWKGHRESLAQQQRKRRGTGAPAASNPTISRLTLVDPTSDLRPARRNKWNHRRSDEGQPAGLHLLHQHLPVRIHLLLPHPTSNLQPRLATSLPVVLASPVSPLHNLIFAFHFKQQQNGSHQGGELSAPFSRNGTPVRPHHWVHQDVQPRSGHEASLSWYYEAGVLRLTRRLGIACALL